MQNAKVLDKHPIRMSQRRIKELPAELYPLSLVGFAQSGLPSGAKKIQLAASASSGILGQWLVLSAELKVMRQPLTGQPKVSWKLSLVRSERLVEQPGGVHQN